MRAYDHEVDKALKDGVELLPQVVPVEIVGNGAVEAITCRRTELGDPDPTGRPQVTVVEGTEFELEVTRVLRATGQAPYGGFFAGIPEVEMEGTRVVVNDMYRTGHERVWAGGDCVNGGKEVVNAVEHGKQAARDIDRMLQASVEGN